MSLLFDYSIFNNVLSTLTNLTAAFVLGGAIGYERQYRQRMAGLRTNVLVCVGAAVFVNLSNNYGVEGTARVISYVVSGIGFLGAGVILREEGNIRGLNTAATLWGAAAVGCCAGAGYIIEACIATVFVLAANTLLRPIVHTINQRPIKLSSVESDIELYVITENDKQKEVLRILKEQIKKEGLKLREVDIESFGEDEVEIQLLLNVHNISSSKINNLVVKLNNNPLINQAFWGPSSRD